MVGSDIERRLHFPSSPYSLYRGYNRFMNDVKMMLGKRPAQYYLFTTWCITAPVLMLVSETSRENIARERKDSYALR